MSLAGLAHARDLLLHICQQCSDFVAGVDADALNIGAVIGSAAARDAQACSGCSGGSGGGGKRWCGHGGAWWGRWWCCNNSCGSGGGGVDGGGGGDVLKQLLAHASAPVLGLLQFAHPVVDGGVELGQGFLLLEEGLLAELDGARGAQVLADAGVEITAPSAKGMVGAAEVFTALVKASQFLELS